MKSPEMRIAHLAPLLLVPSLAQDVPLDVTSLALSGTGCPEGTYELDIMGSGGFIFGAFEAALGSDSGTSEVACRAAIGVEVDQGYRVVLEEVVVSGAAGLDDEVVARVNITASWEGDEGHAVSICSLRSPYLPSLFLGAQR